MTAFPDASASKMGNIVVNPSGTEPGEVEVFLRCPGWWILDMSQTLAMPDVRGGPDNNDVIPGVSGRLANVDLDDQGVYVFPMRMTGEVNATGGDYPSALSGLKTNRDFLRANVDAQPPTGPTRVVKVIWPDGSSTLIDAQTKLTIGAQQAADLLAEFRMIVPQGAIE